MIRFAWASLARPWKTHHLQKTKVIGILRVRSHSSKDLQKVSSHPPWIDHHFLFSERKRKILSGNTKRFSCRKKLGWTSLDQATAFTILETVATINCTCGNCFSCFTCGLPKFSSHIKLFQKGSPKGRGRRLIPQWLERRFYEFSHQCLYNSVYSILKLF